MEMLSRRQRQQLRQCRQYSAQILLSCCLLAVASGYIFLSPGLAAFSASFQDNSLQSSISQEAAQPVIPLSYAANSVVRDPFAVPKEFQPVVPIPTEQPPIKNYTSVAGAVSSPPKLLEIPLTLVGVVSGGGQKVAIIKNGSNSRTYQIKEYIGPYQLISVGESSATLWGPQGEKVLILER